MHAAIATASLAITSASPAPADVERVISAAHDVELRARAEHGDHRTQPAQRRELVARALDEQQRPRGVGEVRRAREARLVGRVQRKSGEHEAAHAGERRVRVGPPNDLPPANAGRSIAARAAAHASRTAASANLGPIRQLLARGHVRKLVAPRRDALVGERGRERFEECVAHARARAVREDEQMTRPARTRDERVSRGLARDPARVGGGVPRHARTLLHVLDSHASAAIMRPCGRATPRATRRS